MNILTAIGGLVAGLRMTSAMLENTDIGNRLLSFRAFRVVFWLSAAGIALSAFVLSGGYVLAHLQNWGLL